MKIDKRFKKSWRYVFWRYDQFPYVLGAPVLLKNMGDDGWVKPEGYGGNSFRPIHVCDLGEGITLQNKLDELKARRETMLSSLNKMFNFELSSIMPDALRIA